MFVKEFYFQPKLHVMSLYLKLVLKGIYYTAGRYGAIVLNKFWSYKESKYNFIVV